MIDLNFGLWWSGAKLSYLRYLTFKSLRYYHPNSKIQLFIGDTFNKSGYKWGVEKQDFESPEDLTEDYIERLNDLGVEMKHVNFFGQYVPSIQSDFFRYWFMKSFGGFYADTDQIILRSFVDLPLDKEFIYCRYNEKQCGDYFPVGILGMERDSPIADIIMNQISVSYSPNNYNSAGPFMMRDVIGKIDLSRSFNAPYNYFYPIKSSLDVANIFNGTAMPYNESFALHWFGGSPVSQEFNRKYTRAYAQGSNDTISNALRARGIL